LGLRCCLGVGVTCVFVCAVVFVDLVCLC